MLRAWFHLGSVITLRLIMVLSALLVTRATDGDCWRAMPCGEIEFILADSTNESASVLYPQCFFANGTIISDSSYAPVKSVFGDNVAQVRSSLTTTFGMAGWLALFIHAIGVEIYLRLTPRECEQLRMISYQRQLAIMAQKPIRNETTSAFRSCNAQEPKANAHWPTIRSCSSSLSDPDVELVATQTSDLLSREYSVLLSP